MPSPSQHLAKERAAAEAEVALRAAGLVDWAITALFYRAMHLVEARFGAADVHYSSHARRARAVAQELASIDREYTTLLELSRTARYEAPGLLNWDDYEIARRYLASIEAAVRANRT